jgi:hypothetical protein
MSWDEVDLPLTTEALTCNTRSNAPNKPGINFMSWDEVDLPLTTEALTCNTRSNAPNKPGINFMSWDEEDLPLTTEVWHATREAMPQTSLGLISCPGMK